MRPAFHPAVITLCLALHSCTAPSGQNFYVRSADALPLSYDFSMDFSDSLSTYDLYFYTQTPDPLHLTVRWLSPSDSLCLADTVWLRPCGSGGVRQLYRSGVRPPQRGVWRICVSLPDRPVKAPDGIGIISERKDGTR